MGIEIMGNVNYTVPLCCQKCRHYSFSQDGCKKGLYVEPHYYGFDCTGFEKRKTLFDLLKKLFYNFIMCFQDYEQLVTNPEWIKFIDECKGEYKL